MGRWLGWGDYHDERTTGMGVSIVIHGHGWRSYAYLILLVLPVKPHPSPSRRDEGLLGDGKQAIESNTERADLLFVRISLSWITTSAV